MNTVLRILAIVFCSVALCFLLVTAGLSYSAGLQQTGKVELNAEIIELHNSRPVVGYELNGERYTYTPSIRSTGFRLGQSYPLWVDPARSGQVFDPAALNLISLIFGAIGGVFLIVGIICLVIRRRSLHRYDALLTYGRSVTGIVTGTEVQTNVTLNRRHPVVLLVSCCHPLTGQQVQVRSESVFRNELRPGDPITVLFDPNDPDNYVVRIGET